MNLDNLKNYTDPGMPELNIHSESSSIYAIKLLISAFTSKDPQDIYSLHSTTHNLLNDYSLPLVCETAVTAPFIIATMANEAAHICFPTQEEELTVYYSGESISPADNTEL